MYVTLYQWRIKTGKEKQFSEAWTKLTQQLQATVPGLSGRLHKTPQGSFLATIDWPSLQAWESQDAKNIDFSLQQQLMDSIEDVESVIPMEVVSEIGPRS